MKEGQPVSPMLQVTIWSYLVARKEIFAYSMFGKGRCFSQCLHMGMSLNPLLWLTTRSSLRLEEATVLWRSDFILWSCRKADLWHWHVCPALCLCAKNSICVLKITPLQRSGERQNILYSASLRFFKFSTCKAWQSSCLALLSSCAKSSIRVKRT